ncbi:hypothetical protein [Micromonospora sp. RV43]|uniref:hypothetical protein n=1 Tax=Micromonospora sp. RV43 TaxID=1661387 RepID=UPI00064C3699|nr:hypothetical protein [Micromonospora sp. RV43]
MTTPTHNFLGIPIDGQINRSKDRKEQRPLSELEPLLRAVIDDPTIVEFGWRQYTPYFNDGDACEFGVCEPWFRTTSDNPPAADDDWDAEDDTYELEFSTHPTLGERPGTYNRTTRSYEYSAYVGPDEARYDRVRDLSIAIQSGHFDDVLLDAFGDHCHVRVRRSGITLTEYSHD